jgi:hypothetical protein
MMFHEYCYQVSLSCLVIHGRLFHIIRSRTELILFGKALEVSLQKGTMIIHGATDRRFQLSLCF